MPTGSSNTIAYVLIAVIAVFFLLLLIGRLAVFYNDFSLELKYVNSEIKRNDGSERRYWIKKRRRLLLSIIPFFKY